MKKAFVLLAFAGFISAAAAQPAAPSAPSVAAGSLSQVDTMAFCYYEGKPYSKGSVLNGMQCIEPASMIVGNHKPLEWVVRK